MSRSVTLLLAMVAAFLAASAQAATLPATVARALEHRKLPAESLSVYVENLRTGETIVSWMEDEPRNPASVAKLVTTLVALDMLGPAYTWKTDVYLLGEIEEQTLKGDLLLKGYGDPFLVTERLWSMLREVQRAGVRRIEGNVLLDDSYFDVDYYDPGAFDNAPLRAYNVAPNALLMNFKVVRYEFAPDRNGGTVNVELDPKLENLQVVNRLSLKDGQCSGYQRGISISANETLDQVIFSGAFPRGCDSYAMARTALGHNDFAYGLVKSLWQGMGGEIEGGWRNVVAPEDEKPFRTFHSPSLGDVIRMVNKHSNNVMAHQLLYTLAAETFGPPATEEKGLEIVNDWLAERRLTDEKLQFDNGAGLSRSTRITARNIGDMLRYAWASPYMPEFVSSMSLAGLDGTMSRRFRHDALVGMAHAKTGSLDGVAAVAGYLQSRSGERYLVVSLQNHEGVQWGTGREVQEALMRWIVESL